MKLRLWLCAVLFPLSLSACGEDTVGIPISGINYTGQEFDGYILQDPENEKNRGGGEPIGPYAAGGMMCCYVLPEQWHEGMQVEVIVRRAMTGETYDERTAEYVRKRDNGTLDETVLVDVPPYEADDIQRSGIWVEMLPDDRFGVVVSHVDPNHKDWPGEIKGWPVPSDEYRKKIALERLPRSSSELEMFSTSLNKAKDSDPEVLSRYWEILKKDNPDLDAMYSGYQDEKFQEEVVRRLEFVVDQKRKEVEALQRVAQ